MITIHRTLALSAILLLSAVCATARPRSETRFANPLLDDVVQMTRAELPDATIVAYLRARRARLEADVTASDLIRLRRAGVREKVLAYVAGVADIDVRIGPADKPADQADDDVERGRDRDRYVGYESRGDSAVAVDPYDDPDSDDGETAVAVYPRSAYPYWYAYSPYGFGYPYGYGFGYGFGGSFFIGGRFHGGGFHRGGGHRGGHSNWGGHRGGHSNWGGHRGGQSHSGFRGGSGSHHGGGHSSGGRGRH